MKDCHPIRIPMESRQVQSRRFKQLAETENQENHPKVPYREAIGSLLYLSGGTRPDISYAVNILSRCQSKPTIEDWEDVKKLFRYLKGTIDLGLKYTGETNELMAESDSSFSDWTDSTSTGGILISLYGDPIIWRSYKQALVSQSVCKSEMRAMSDACREVVSIDKTLREITGKTLFPVTLWCDNSAACNNTQMEGHHKRCDFDDDLENIYSSLKFREVNGVRKELLDTHGDYVKQLAKEGKIIVKWVKSELNRADIFTKPLEYNSHRRFTCEILKLKH